MFPEFTVFNPARFIKRPHIWVHVTLLIAFYLLATNSFLSPHFFAFFILIIWIFGLLALRATNIKTFKIQGLNIIINDEIFSRDEIAFIRSNLNTKLNSVPMTIITKKDGELKQFTGSVKVKKLDASQIRFLITELTQELEKSGAQYDPSLENVHKEHMTNRKYFTYFFLSTLIGALAIFFIYDSTSYANFESEIPYSGYYLLPLIAAYICYFIFNDLLIKTYAPVYPVSSNLRHQAYITRSIISYVCSVIVFVSASRGIFYYNRFSSEAKWELVTATMTDVTIRRGKGCSATGHFRSISDDRVFETFIGCDRARFMPVKKNYYLSVVTGPLGIVVYSDHPQHLNLAK